MNEQLITRYKKLNQDIGQLISEKVQIAREFYLHNYPALKVGNYVYCNSYNDQIILVDEVQINFSPYYLRETSVNQIIYDTPMEKEFDVMVAGQDMISTGVGKKRSNGRSVDRIRLICSKDEYPNLAVEHGISLKPTYHSLNTLYQILNNSLESYNVIRDIGFRKTKISRFRTLEEAKSLIYKVNQ